MVTSESNFTRVAPGGSRLLVTSSMARPGKSFIHFPARRSWAGIGTSINWGKKVNVIIPQLLPNYPTPIESSGNTTPWTWALSCNYLCSFGNLNFVCLAKILFVLIADLHFAGPSFHIGFGPRYHPGSWEGRRYVCVYGLSEWLNPKLLCKIM